MLNFDRIAMLCKLKGWSRAEMLRRVGLSPSAINDWRMGKASPEKHIPKLVEVLGTTEAYLCGEDDSPFPIPQEAISVRARVPVPVLGEVMAGPNSVAEQYFEGYEYADEADPQRHFYLRVKGDSMEPDFRAGDFLLVDKEAEIMNGDFAVVIVDSEEGTVKIVHYQNDVVVLSSINPAYPPRICSLKDIFFCGKVVELKRKLQKHIKA